ncbi:hypothetical protein AU381_00125 [Sinorhizobium glycinis]|uniref:Chromosomal replication initiator DnaA C-terminal domain-containing protein n=1 Tax=Sinorhizobium glycinis TaxID=1472378 RepID=A0A178XYH4_9HYPH|nr:helix-turn-helix domain-containing protein [Sinorhizobium glycinis]OAP40369.1 hypothetical protein AU381_00125 [Sinorhizobium glycinis]
MIYQPLEAETFTSAADMTKAYAARRARLMGPAISEPRIRAVLPPTPQVTRAERPLWQREPVQFDSHLSAWREHKFKKVANRAKRHVQRRAESLGYSLGDIIGPSRVRTVTAARQLLMWEVWAYFGKSYPEIGRMFGGRDHTTVLHAVKKIEAQKAKAA